MPLLIVFGVASIAILVLASNVAVKKLTGLAGFFRLSTTFMGVTVVSLATSIPEIAAHYTASFGILSGALDFKVSSAVVLGANIGSDVIQQTLIMALVILMAGGLHFKRYFLWKSMIPMIATTVMCIILGARFSSIHSLVICITFIRMSANIIVRKIMASPRKALRKACPKMAKKPCAMLSSLCSPWL
jgi:cation:H+ antiporter